MTKINYETYRKPSNFIKLAVGENRVRLVSDGITCYEHGAMMGGKYVPLGICTENLNCRQCQKNSEPKLKFKWIVFCPTTHEIGVLSVGPEAGDAICRIGREVKKNIEVVIVRKGLTREDTTYRVLSVDSTPIDQKTALFIKERRDYLAKKYLGI